MIVINIIVPFTPRLLFEKMRPRFHPGFKIVAAAAVEVVAEGSPRLTHPSLCRP